ncbi:MAG: DinB family protein [Bacteroidales bacterium]
MRTNRQGRNIKQLIGHLVDSASNNHQRLVRLQYAVTPVFPDYTFENDVWISVQHYQQEDWYELVQLWKYYNLHLAHVISHTDQGWLNNEWTNGSSDPISLRDIIFNYMAHLTLHLNEIEQLICLQVESDV